LGDIPWHATACDALPMSLARVSEVSGHNHCCCMFHSLHAAFKNFRRARKRGPGPLSDNVRVVKYCSGIVRRDWPQRELHASLPNLIQTTPQTG
jgi:hypothetical protein